MAWGSREHLHEYRYCVYPPYLVIIFNSPHPSLLYAKLVWIDSEWFLWSLELINVSSLLSEQNSIPFSKNALWQISLLSTVYPLELELALQLIKLESPSCNPHTNTCILWAQSEYNYLALIYLLTGYEVENKFMVPKM